MVGGSSTHSCQELCSEACQHPSELLKAVTSNIPGMCIEGIVLQHPLATVAKAHSQSISEVPYHGAAWYCLSRRLHTTGHCRLRGNGCSSCFGDSFQRPATWQSLRSGVSHMSSLSIMWLPPTKLLLKHEHLRPFFAYSTASWACVWWNSLFLAQTHTESVAETHMVFCIFLSFLLFQETDH